MSGAVTGSRREPAQDSLVNRGPDQIRKGCGNMGRISKRGSSVAVASGENKDVAAGGKKRYKAGIYARLSADADARKNESIGIQEEISRKYVEEMNRNNREIIDIIGCYRDLGKTGSNFNREGFLRLMQDIRQGNIDCVIVKDLSRFGRNYLEAGDYIEKIFPFLGVRFIAVSDGIDTGDKGNDTKQMATEIKNLVNDMYAKDFSGKAKEGLQQRRKAGAYVGGPPPYGYRAAWEGKIRKLIPDENTAEIINHIYRLFTEKESYAAVTDDLNRKRVNPPAVYKETGEVYCLPDMEYKGWDKSAVERIIRSRTYVGTLAQGKSSLTARDERNRVYKSEEEWVVRENAHKALVSAELYRKVQKTREKIRAAAVSRRLPSQGTSIEENVFERVLYCGFCGKKMTRYSHFRTYVDGHKGRLEGYSCLNGGRAKAETCQQSNRISKQELTEILTLLLRTEVAVRLDRQKRFVEAGKEQLSNAMACYEKEIGNMQRRAERMEEESTDFYMAYREGKLSQKEYVSFKTEREECLRELEKQLKEKRRSMEEMQERNLKTVCSLLKLKSAKELTVDMVDIMIEKIRAYPGKRIEVELKYMDKMLEDGVFPVDRVI